MGALLSDAGPPPAEDNEAAAMLHNAKLQMWEDSCEEGQELPALRCGGFSVVTAVKRNGFLLRASAEASVVRWEDGLYGFVNEDEAEAFAANPNEYMSALHGIVIRTPELVRLLRLEDVVPTLRMSDIVEAMTAPLTCDFGTQTPTHFVEKHIDRNYEVRSSFVTSFLSALGMRNRSRIHERQVKSGFVMNDVMNDE